MNRFEELGQRVAALQDVDRQSLRAYERAAEGFIQELRRRRRRRSTPTAFLAAALVGITAAVGLVWWVGSPSARPLTLSPSAGVTVGGSIVVPHDRAIPLGFSDGSQLWLAAGTRASVRQLTVDSAFVDIESGKAQVSVVRRAETNWRLRAGPYQVGVTGTRFDLEWLPERDRFTLELKQGSVMVTADNSSHGALRMAAPECLVIDHGLWQVSPLRDGSSWEPSVEQSPPPRAFESAQTPAARAPSASGAVAQTPPPAGTASALEWQSLGKLGRYHQAYGMAQTLGIERLSRTSSGQELLTLAEVCRFSGHGGQAVSVLTSLRQRFSGTEESAIAAFQLGRLCSGGQQAADWFRTYLRERPNGELAREAAGRLLEALDRAGDSAGAATAARSYLKSYPSGPHAAFARRILGG